MTINRFIRTVCLLAAAMLLTGSLTGCRKFASEQTISAVEYASYRDIPGVTEEEIAVIEAFRSSGREFSYGILDSTEVFLKNDGERDGFAVLFCDLLSKLFGIPFKYKIYGWTELINDLENMSLDFTGETTPTEVRQGSMDQLFNVDGEMVPGKGYMMSVPIAERMFRVFTRADSSIHRETDLAGLTIGFLEGTTTEHDIKQSYRIKFNAVEIIVPEDAGDDVDDYDIAVRMLERGEIDAFVEEATADSAFIKYNQDKETIRSMIFFKMVHSPVSLTTVNPELAAIISVVDKYIEAGGSYRLYDLYTEGDFRYSKHKLYNSFTPEEKAYLEDLEKRGAAVRLACEHDNYPVDFYNETDGMFEGIALDVLAEISRFTGLRFDTAVSKDVSWAEIYEKFTHGEIDMVAQLLYSEQRGENFLWTSVPYASTSYVLMSRSDFPFLALHQVARMSVGVIKASGKVDMYREMFPANNNLVEYDTQFQTLDALERGEIDLLMASEYNLLAETNYRERSGLMINIKLDQPMESYFGFPKKMSVLRSIIDKAQMYVDTGIIEMSWTGRQFDYSKKLAAERTLYMTIFIALMALVIIVMMFVLMKNVKLSRKLKDMARNDALTNIYNRRYFMEIAEIQAAKSERTGNDSFIIIFDLDHFKLVNDTHGHQAGDKVLKDTSQRVAKMIRPYDTFARYGGEEFVILMADVGKKEDVICATERIRMEICKAPVEFEGKEIPVSASFGIAYAAPKNNTSTAIKYSDEALYKAKEAGRNRVVFNDSGESDADITNEHE